MRLHWLRLGTYLLHDGANILQRQRTKLVLLQKVIEVLLQ
jgi:hypothetical protein